MPPLPPAVFANEVFDYIMDYLHNDPITLRTCSLTSRRLLTSSRYHLFEAVRLNSHNATKFLQVALTASFSTMISSIRFLELHWDNNQLGASTLFEVLPHIHKLHSLECLAYCGLDWNRLGVELQSEFLACSCLLRDLPVTELVFEDSDAGLIFWIMDTIAACPRLERLQIDCVHWDEDWDEDFMHLRVSPRLNALILDTCDPRLLLMWLASQSAFPSFRDVSLSLMTDTAYPISNFLRLVGSSLDQLRLKIPYFTRTELTVGEPCVLDVFARHADLSSHTVLRSLTIRVPVGGNRTECPDLPNCISQLLSTISSSSLEEFHLACYIPGLSRLTNLESQEWGYMLSILRGRSFSRLRTIQLPSFLTTDDRFQGLLNPWRDRHILEVCLCSLDSLPF